jgi:Fe-S cluster assembly protein SufB
MKYPCVYRLGERSHGEVLSIALAGDGQHQDTGAKMFHMAPNTTSRIISKSISKGAGRASYRGWAKIVKQATGCKTQVQCDALLLDGASRSDTYPTMEVAAQDATVEHEARVSKLADDQLFYLQSRGIDLEQARLMVVNGFIEPFVRELPMEYAVELNRLIQLEMEGSVG